MSELLNTEDAVGLVGEYLTESQPFGPIDASVINPKHRDVIRALFDVQNRSYEALRGRPTVIMGRRGSGKTACLRSLYFDRRYPIVIELKSSTAFANVIRQIEGSVPGSSFPEAISDLWETLFYCALFSRLVNEHGRADSGLGKVRDYLAKVGVREQRTADEVLWTVVETLSDKLAHSSVGVVAEVLRKTAGTSFDEAREAATTFMRQRRLAAVVLLDSLDEYPLHSDCVSNTLKGLLKCVGQFNSPGKVLDARFCLPTELYHGFMDISSNPLKDFEHRVVLHWHAKELLSIAVHRLLLFLRARYPDAFAKVRHLNPDHYADALALFYSVFPKTLRNALGVEEQTFPYILRHTQLLPRHLLMYLNSIYGGAIQETLYGEPTIDEVRIRAGVSAKENQLCGEIFSAYSVSHPAARRVCERCIPALPFRFDVGSLHEVFNKHGKKAMGTDDFADFKRMLIEIGVVGRVLGETERYVTGLFEYTVPHRLVTSTEDELCLHPVFLKVFSAKKPPPGGMRKTVYPFGTDADGRDYRDWNIE